MNMCMEALILGVIVHYVWLSLLEGKERHCIVKIRQERIMCSGRLLPARHIDIALVH